VPPPDWRFQMTSIATALEAIRPLLADRYANQVRRSFSCMIKALGPTLNGVYNSYDFAANYRGLIAQYVTTAADGTCAINEDRLAAGAAAYAEAATIEWQAKIDAKVGQLENIEIKQWHGCNFLISGHRDGRAVAIDQDMILKASTKGKLFNQFPARIYVDGKFTPEKKYHEMFA